MTSERFKQLEELFDGASQLSGAERDAWLEVACGEDAALREEIRALLVSDEVARGFVQAKVEDGILGLHAADPCSNQAAPSSRRIGPYRVMGELGRGGMGAVYLAERADGQYEGQVAIKLIRAGMDSDFFLTRFRRERQTLARLRHPNIARLLDSGTTEDGLPYIVMERVEGKPIHVYCHEERLQTRQKIRLFLPVCAAVSHAHQNFVVHRDLKPGNILVEADGNPKLLDFGICKLLFDDPSGEAPETKTMTGVQMMTPEYASPEQVRGENIAVASDVYSLGAVLYELLTGSRVHSIDKHTPQAVERAVCEVDVRPPSAATADRTLARELSGDLDTILLKALQKDPARRYPSVEQFAEDLRRYLSNQPISARPDTVAYRVRKFALRNRGPLAAAALILLSLTTGLVLYAREAARARNQFAEARRLANAMIFDIHDRVRDLPGSLPARQAIMRIGLAYLDRLSAKARNDADLRRDLSAAYLRMGEVQGNVFGSNAGDTSGALASWRKGLDILQPLPSSLPVDLDRMVLHLRIGEVLSYTKSVPAALESYERAQEIGTALHERYPESDDVRKRLANVYESMGRTIRLSEDRRRALEVASKALGLYRELLAAHPQDRQIRAAVASAIASVGTIQAGFNQLEAARANHLEVVSQWEELCRLEPSNSQFQRERMFAYGHLGDVLGNPNYDNLGDAAGALKAFHSMLSIAEKLHEGNPGDVNATIDYGMALMRMAGLPGQEPTERLVLYRKGAEFLSEAAHKDPSHRTNRINLAALHEQVGNLLAGMGRLEEARESYRKGLALAQETAAASVSSQRIFVTTARQLAEDAARRGNAAEALDYARRALAIAEAAAAQPGAPVPQRVLRPRAYASMGSVYTLLGHPQEALRWRERAMEEFRQLEHEPGFTSIHREDMQRVEVALKTR